MAELQIPPTALPEGVNVDDVSITKVPEAETALVFEGEGQFYEYHLEPDGLEFSEEVMFNVTLKNVNDTIPIVLQITENSVEMVNNTWVDIDLENNTIVVSAPLTHFSRILVRWAGEGFSLTASATDTMLEQYVPAKAVFTVRSTPYINFLLGSTLTSSISVSDVKIRGRTVPGIGGKLSPQENYEGRPPETPVAPGSSFTIPCRDFYCAKLGKDTVRFWLTVDYTETCVTKDESGNVVDEPREYLYRIYIRAETPVFWCTLAPPAFRGWRSDWGIDYEYNELAKMDREQIYNLPDRIHVYAQSIYYDAFERHYWFPFPETQWTIQEPHEDCSDYHYHGEFGYSITPNPHPPKFYQLDKLPEPPDSPCGWRVVGMFDGILELSPEQLIEWFEFYPGQEKADNP